LNQWINNKQLRSVVEVKTMSGQATELPEILSEENEELSAFVPAITFGYLYIYHDITILLLISLYSLLAAVHSYLSENRQDIPSENSTLGVITLEIPLLVSFPVAVGFLIPHLSIEYGVVRTTEVISTSLLLANASIIFSGIYHLYVNERN
jgi:hypothetical protein